MKMVNAQTGALDDVPDDQVAAAYQAKTHGFESGDQRVPIKKSDGSLVTVPASQAHVAFASGATIATPQDIAQAKYGGVGGQAVTSLQGAIRGATVGGSDWAAVHAAGLIGGDKAKEAVRQNLEEHKLANPWTAGVSEVVGAAVPTLLSGGSAAPEEAAALGGEAVARGAAEVAPEAVGLGSNGAGGTLIKKTLAEELGVEQTAKAAAAPSATASAATAQAPSRAAQLLRAIGAPARAVAGAGEVAGRAAESVLGAPGAGGALARIARAAAKSGVTAAAEGGLFGAGNEISEDVLGDHELNAEKLVASIGHGALFGWMLGSAGGALGRGVSELGSSVLDRVAPGIERQANIEAYKGLHPKLGLTKEVVARAGGEAEVGAVARKFKLFGDSVSDAATSGPEEVLQRTQAAKESVGQAISEKLEASGNAGAAAKASEVVAPLQKQIEELEATTAGAQKAGPLREFRDQMAQRLGLTTETVPKTSAEVQQWIKENPEALANSPNGKLPPEAFTKQVTKDADVGIQQLVKERRALQQNVYQYTKSLNAPLHIEELRKFSGHLNDLEEQVMDRAADAVGGKPGAEFRALNKDYQRLSLIERATQERVATQGTNQRLSLTDKMFAGAEAAGALASGHPMGAIGSGAVALASKAVRERGNAVASVALGKLAKLDMIARASQGVDADLEGALSKFAESKPQPKIRLRHFGNAASSDETPRDRYNKAAESVPAKPVKIAPEHVEAAIPGLGEHAPKTATSLGNVVGAGSAYLAARQPKAPGMPSALGREPALTEQQMSTFARQHAAVNDPVGVVRRALETGKVHKDEIDTIQATKPKLFAQIQRMGLDTVAKHRDSMSYDKIVTISKLTKIPLDPSLTPANVQYLQGTYKTPAASGPVGQPVKGAPKRKLQGIAATNRLDTGLLTEP